MNPSELKILVVAPDVVAERVAGPNIRAIAIARELSKQFDTTLAVPDGSTFAPSAGEPPYKIREWSRGSILNWLGEYDIAISQGTQWPARGSLKPIGQKPLHVFDVYNAFLFEHLASHPRKLSTMEFHAIRRLIKFVFQRGDYFICASPQQRDLWLGVLYGTRRLEEAWGGGDVKRATLDSLISVVPFGHDGDEIRRSSRPVLKGIREGIGENDQVILWGGGIWNWFDPLTLVRAMKRLEKDYPRAKLFFMASRHPNPVFRDNDMALATVKLAGDLKLLDKNVFFNHGWVPFDQRTDYLLEADLAACVAPDSPENHFSFRTRLLDSIWAGTPIVLNEGSFLADFVEKKDIGFTFKAGDDAELAAKLARALDEKAQSEMRARLAACRDELRWDNCLKPLVEYCRQVAAGELPLPAPKAESSWKARKDYMMYKAPTMIEKIAHRIGNKLGRGKKAEQAPAAPTVMEKPAAEKAAASKQAKSAKKA